MVTLLHALNEGTLAQGVALLREGAVLAFPTDTVYGLGCDVFNHAAIEKVYAIKQRPTSMQLPVLMADMHDLELIVRDVPPLATTIAQLGWPGALTLVLQAQTSLPAIVYGSSETIAVRIPDHPLLRQLIREFGRPIVGTSANLHGQPVPPTAAEVQQQLQGRLPLVFDGGPAASEQPSTIIDLSGVAPRIVRRGAFDLHQLQHLLPMHMIQDSDK